LFCFVAGISWVSAQITSTTEPEQNICKPNSGSFSKYLDGTGYAIQWYEKKGNVWVLFTNPNGPSLYRNESGEFKCIITKAGVSDSAFYKLAVHDVPYVPSITLRSICDGGNLEATTLPTDYIKFQDDSPYLTYEWILDGKSVGSGKIYDKENPQLTLNEISESQNGSILLLSVANDRCGKTTKETYITVRRNPLPPTFIPVNHCEGQKLDDEKDALKIIGTNEAIWYNEEGTQLTKAPVPDTSTPGEQTWWVKQKMVWSNNDPDYGLECISGSAKATVTILPLSDTPITDHVIPMCLNDPDKTLEAVGVNLKWYTEALNSLNAAPQINTSLAANQTYYVTQTKANECESPKENGKITVQIRDRAKTDDIILSDIPRLCPTNSTIIEATLSNPKPNPIFKWYANSDKTGRIEGDEIQTTPRGSILSTPELMKDTVYYVTLEYDGVCESSYPKAAIVNVGDIELPYFYVLNSNNEDSIVYILPRIEYYTDHTSCQVENDRTRIPLVKDNCTKPENLRPFTDPEWPEYYVLGDTTLVWWVIDDAINKVYALQNISVKDTIPPTGRCPADFSWYIDESENSAVVTYDMSYTDNCGDVKYELLEGLPSDTIFQFGVTRVVHRISDRSGNTRICSFNVTVKYPERPLQVDINATSGNTICLGQEVVITSSVSGGSGRYIYSWKPRVWSDPVFRDYPLKDTRYELTVKDGVDSLTKFIDVKVLETRDVKLVLEGVKMDQIFEGDEVLVTATYGFSSYKLLLNNEVIQEIGLNNQVSFQAELGNYFIRVFATDENFCVTQDQLLIEVESRKLPNAFTPNSSDGKNRLFLEGFDLQVFTRSGELLYKGFGGWDGHYKGKLMPQGTYLYVVRRIMNNGQLWEFKGVVTLKQ